MTQQEKLIAELNEINFDNAVAEGVTLVDFWAPWCAPCLMQAPILESVAQGLNEEVTIGKVNVDMAPGLAERFEIRGIPTLILFKDGEAVQRFGGVHPKDILVAAIKKVL